MIVNRFFLVVLVCVLISCSKSTSDSDFCADPLSCKDCVSVVQKVSGKTLFLSCFDRYGVYFEQDDSTRVWAIPYEWDSEYQSDSIDINFCGYLFTNDVPLEFPDPSIGPVYRIKFEDIR